MQDHNLFLCYIDKLNHLGIQYFITGSVAAIIYGEPRLTHDIDIVIYLNERDIAKFVAEFPENEFYVPPMEVIKNEIKREVRGHFNLICHESGFKADIYPIGNDSLHIWAMKNRKEYEVDNTLIFVAPPEYVIIRKLQYYEEGNSDKHLRDIRNIIADCIVPINYNFIREHLTSTKLISLFNLIHEPHK